jgi:ribosomal protein S9
MAKKNIHGVRGSSKAIHSATVHALLQFDKIVRALHKLTKCQNKLVTSIKEYELMLLFYFYQAEKKKKVGKRRDKIQKHCPTVCAPLTP